MPAKNVIRRDVSKYYYHVYNRGVEKRLIFLEEQDYKVFLKYLKEYLSPPKEESERKTKFIISNQAFIGIPHQVKNYFGKIELVAYCLMPNHFHFLLYQNAKGFIEQFMRSLLVRYSMYFNKKYNRVGSLFQGPYKAIIIENENYLLHLSRYIHLNPSSITKNLVEAYSSYADYIGIRKTAWVKPRVVLSYFETAKSELFKHTPTYKNFVERFNKNPEDILNELILE